MKDKRDYKPFAKFEFYKEWTARNCDSCKKGFDNKRRQFGCKGERMLCVAMIGNGKVTKEVAKAIGFLDSEGCDLWECPEWTRR